MLRPIPPPDLLLQIYQPIQHSHGLPHLLINHVTAHLRSVHLLHLTVPLVSRLRRHRFNPTLPQVLMLPSPADNVCVARQSVVTASFWNQTLKTALSLLVALLVGATIAGLTITSTPLAAKFLE